MFCSIYYYYLKNCNYYYYSYIVIEPSDVLCLKGTLSYIKFSDLNESVSQFDCFDIKNDSAVL